MKHLLKLTFTVLVLFIQVRVSAQFTWNFTSSSPTGAIANITASNIVSVNSNCGGFLANGLPASALPGASGGRNGNSCTKTGALSTATSTYVEVVLTPSAVSWVNVTAIEWGNYSFNATGPTTYSIYSSADNFSTSAATVTSAQNSTWTLLNPAISLTGITGTNLTIRIYASGGGSAATNWRIDDLKITATAQSGTAGQLAKFTSSTTVANSIVTELNNKIGIGTTTPAAKLDVAGNFKLTDGTQGAGKVLTSDANGLTSWQTSFGNNVWALAGNNATNPGPNFIGTTDNKGLMFKTNNIQSGFIDLVNFNTSFGNSALKNNTTGNQNTAIGTTVLSTNTTGYANTAIGNSTLSANTTGYLNVATGVNTLVANTTGTLNTGIGSQSLYFNTTGDRNAASGYGALLSNTTGSFNTANGNVAGSSITTGSNNSLLGSNTGVGIITGSNNTILGANVTGLAANLSNNIIIADGSGNRRINVDASGNVGIGTITAAAKLDVAGTIKVADGTQATGKVLTSDANGLASWQTPAITGISNIIAVNGLTAVNANTIKLGGSLTEHTVISGSNLYDLTVENANYIVRGATLSGQAVSSYSDAQMFFNPGKAAFRAGSNFSRSSNC